MRIPAYQLQDGMVIVTDDQQRWPIYQVDMGPVFVHVYLEDGRFFMPKADDMVMVDASSIPVPTGCL